MDPSENREVSSFQIFFKKFSFLIILFFLFIAIGILALDYYSIISLRDLNQKTNPEIIKKTQKAGYQVLSVDGNDSEGRTLIGTRKFKNLDQWSDEIRPILKNNILTNTNSLAYFKELEEFSGNDLYLIAETKEKDEFKVRVIGRGSAYSSNKVNFTRLGVEDLDRGNISDAQEPGDIIGAFEDFTPRELEILLKKGDVIRIILMGGEKTEIFRKDEGGYPVASLVVIRRFTGINKVNTELSRK